jgi:hypothetical protein
LRNKVFLQTYPTEAAAREDISRLEAILEQSGKGRLMKVSEPEAMHKVRRSGRTVNIGWALYACYK